MAAMDKQLLCPLWLEKHCCCFLQALWSSPTQLFEVDFSFWNSTTEKGWMDSNFVENLLPFFNQVWEVGLQQLRGILLINGLPIWLILKALWNSCICVIAKIHIVLFLKKKKKAQFRGILRNASTQSKRSYCSIVHDSQVSNLPCRKSSCK